MSSQDSGGHLRIEYGRRLIPVIIDEVTRDSPDKIYAAILGLLSLGRVSFWLDSQFGKIGTSETFAYAGPKDLRYTILIVAAIKSGHTVAFSLCFAGSSIARFGHYPVPDRPDIRFVVVPDCEQWLDEEMREDYAYGKSFEQAKEDTFMIVHTSGTTGLPKPVRYTNGSIATTDAQHILPDPEEKLWWRLVARRRMFSPMPTLHVAGMACSLLYPAFFRTIVVLGPGSGPVSVDIADQVHRFGHVDGALYPPSLLEDICRCPAALENMKTLKFIIFGGSPLKVETGDFLSKHTKLMNYIGSTEVGSYPLF
ncbi:MAG: hypothetical protein M1830_002911 [Pleopsidium flavum]|nr:MAG: hypothetical protein M1830_002911 [Pleopsidium flavum]